MGARRTRIGVLVGVVIVVGAFVAPAGTATAAQSGGEISPAGDSLRVTVPTANVTGPTTDVSINVSVDTSSNEYSFAVNGTGASMDGGVERVGNTSSTYTYSVPLKRVVVNGSDNENAMVTVRVDGTRIVKDRADLRYLAFNGDARYEQGTLVLPVVEPIGFVAGQGVEVNVSGIAMPGQLSDGESSIRVSRNTLRNNAGALQTDLRQASVTTPTGASARFDLRYLALGGSPRLTASSLVVPARTAYGFQNQSTLRVVVRGSGTSKAFNGTFRYADDRGGLITVGTGILRKGFQGSDRALLGEVTVAVQPPNPVGVGTKQVSGSLVPSATNASSLVVTGSGIKLTHPLVFDGKTYRVAVRRVDSGAIYATSTPGESGQLVVENPVLAGARTPDVTVKRNGTVLWQGTGEFRGESDIETVTINETGTNLTVSGLRGSQVAGLWINFSKDGEQRRTRIAGGNVAQTGNTLDISNSPYALRPNATYGFLVVLEGGKAMAARAEGSGGEPTFSYVPNSSASGSDTGADGIIKGITQAPSGLIDWFRQAPLPLQLLLGGTVIVIAGAFVVRYWLLFRSSSSRGADRGTEVGQPTPPRRTATVTVELRDPVTGEVLDQVSTEVDAERIDSSGSTGAGSRDRFGGSGSPGTTSSPRVSESIPIENGRGRKELEQGRWRLSTRGGLNIERTINVSRDGTVKLEPEPRRVPVQVVDAETDEPIPDATVTCRPDAGPDQEVERTEGEVTFEVSRLAGSVEFHADRDRYESASASLDLGEWDSRPITLRLAPETGTLRVEVTVDGAPLPNARVELDPREDWLRERIGGGLRGTTDDRGVATFEDRHIGAYEVRLSGLETAHFSVPTVGAEIEADRTATERIDVGFEFELSEHHLDRLETIEDRIDDLTAPTDRDVAIPRYYGTVVGDLVGLIRRLPDEGQRFASAEADPDAVVEALLDAAEESLDRVSTAMTTKRNVDLFSACRDMTDPGVEWRGHFEAGDLFDWLSVPVAEQRRRMGERLETVNERIDGERSDLGSVAPARGVWEEVRDQIREEPADQVHGAATAFVAQGVLDAVEELFERPALRERLERTVF